MKKVLSMLLAIACLLSLAVVSPATAAAEKAVDLDALFESKLTFLDMYYTLDAEFMIHEVCGELYPWEKAEELNYAPLPTPAAEFEAVLNKYFAPTDKDMEDIRNYPCGYWDGENYTTTPFYDEATDTYQVFFIGGFGGAAPSRQYIGYENTEKGYIAYFARINYMYLPESECAKAEALGWPDTYVYEGNVYENGPDGYVYIPSLGTEGNQYLVTVNEDNSLRILSQSPYTAKDLPPYLDKLEIRIPPINAYAAMGKRIAVGVSATGYDLTYTWYIKNVGSKKFAKSSITASLYETTMSEKVSGRQVYCIVSDGYGNSVKTDTVTLGEAVSVTTQPKTAYAKLNATAKVTVKARGDGLKYQWYVRNSSSTKYTKSSVTKSTYSVTMSSKVKDRRVYCVITDKYGNKVQTKTVILRQAASITTQPKSVKVANKKTAKVTVKASGDGLKYAWYVKNAGATKYTKSSVTKSTYAVAMSSKVNGRRVYCVVTDKYGNKVQSGTVKLSKTTSSSVWVAGSGTKYHSSSSCSNMKNPKKMTVTDAKKAGYTPCSKCN